jgi:hypothetical protein
MFVLLISKTFIKNFPLMFGVNFYIFQLMMYNEFLLNLEKIDVIFFVLIIQKIYHVLHMCL